MRILSERSNLDCYQFPYTSTCRCYVLDVQFRTETGVVKVILGIPVTNTGKTYNKTKVERE